MKLVLLNLAALASTFGLGVMFAEQVKALVTGIPADLRKEATIAWNAVMARAAVAKAEALAEAKKLAAEGEAKLGQGQVSIVADAKEAGAAIVAEAEKAKAAAAAEVVKVENVAAAEAAVVVAKV